MRDDTGWEKTGCSSQAESIAHAATPDCFQNYFKSSLSNNLNRIKRFEKPTLPQLAQLAYEQAGGHFDLMLPADV
jgi:hypothetical protein